MKLDEVREKMEAYIDSEQHEKDIAKLEHLAQLEERSLDKLHQLSIEERSNLIQKVYNKYTSKEYRERELKLGYYEAREPLYDIIFNYGVKYGIPSQYIFNSEENCYFCEEQYDIDGKFIVGAIYGQGTFIYVKPVNDDEIIPHLIEEDKEVTIYNSNNVLICKTKDILIFNDIRIQIAEKNLSGYYFEFDGNKHEIKSNGAVENWPNFLFKININQLIKLIKLQNKK